MAQMKPRKKNAPKAYSLLPHQSLADYKRLEAEWYAKARCSTFQDIEFLDFRGYASPFTKDYSLRRIIQEYSPEAEEYWRRASIFTNEFDWANTPLSGLSPELGRFIWEHYAAGLVLRDIVKAINGTGPAVVDGIPPRRLDRKGRPKAAPSLFWVHLKLNSVLIPTFESWCRNNPDKLMVDWVLDK